MKASTPLIRVVTEAMILGVYRTEAVPEFKLILFLSRRQDGSWTVGGRFPSVEDELLPRIDMPYRTFRRAVQRLIGLGIITSQRLGHSYTYALSQRFVKACHDCCDNWDDHTWSSGMITSGSRDDQVWSSPYRAQEEHEKSATADAARGLRPRGEEPMSDFPTDDGFGPTKKRRSGWGGDSAPALGEDPDRPMASKTVRGPDPRSKAVRDVRQAFEHKLLPISVTKRVPLYGRVGKMLHNIQFMLDQGHDLPVLVGAFDYFASQADSLVFMGESLWDMFFARRDEAIRIATINAIGAHDGPQESQDDKARRLMTRSLRKDA